jgi:hypothetical protein
MGTPAVKEKSVDSSIHGARSRTSRGKGRGLINTPRYALFRALHGAKRGTMPPIDEQTLCQKCISLKLLNVF